MVKRTQTNVLDWFRDNDSEFMHLLTKEFLRTGFFVPYLTPTQYNVLERVTTSSKQVWGAFWSGKISLNLIDKDSSDEKIASPQASEEDTELVFKQGVNAITSLMNTVRCLLYEKAIDYHYSNRMCVEFENALNEISGIDKEDDAANTESVSNLAKVSTEVKETVRGADDDDEYDDDYDEEEQYQQQGESENIASHGEEANESQKESENRNDNSEQVSDNTSNGLHIKSICDSDSGGTSAGDDIPRDKNGLFIFEITKTEMLEKPNYPKLPETTATDDAVGQNIHPMLGNVSIDEDSDVSLQKKNEILLIKNFNKIYHTFEHDVNNIMKKRKLERSNQQLEDEEEEDQEVIEIDSKIDPLNDQLAKDDNTKEPEKGGKLMTFGGAANLTLKNLLNRIEENRDQMNITDIELKNLIMDVRKNRSKWSNYNRIGQEELYEACEKVVTELRGYTEHSTPFLNKVSKREAPNYYEIIKKPMDLNTVLKNLKQLQYTNKQQFVDDLMLIWNNCLLYNSDPKHFIRKDAIAMRKKTLALIPLIPDITIRDRVVVEREAAALAAKEREAENGEQKGRKSTRGGFGTGQASKKGRGSNASDSIDDVTTPADFNIVKLEETDVVAESISTNEPTPIPIPASGLVESTVPDTDTSSKPSDNAEIGNNSLDLSRPGTSGNEVEEEERNLQETKQQGAEAEPDDLEMATWKSVTSATRYRLCVDRGRLFKNGVIQPDSEAIMRDCNQMWNFEKYLAEDSAAKEDSFSGMKSYLKGNSAVMHRNRRYYDENDDPYLIEYDVTGGVPEVKHDNTPLDQIENKILEDLLESGKTLDVFPESRMKIHCAGSSSMILDNIAIMQDVRRLCFKINLIRQMQTNKFVHQSQFVAPPINRIKLEDIDPMSKLPTRDLMNHDISQMGLKKAICALVMHNGFESTSPSCAMTLTQIAETYMGNLAKTLKLHMESTSINKIPGKNSSLLGMSDILQIVLSENGIEKPDALYTFYKESLVKKNKKLVDIKLGLESFLKDLLRPSIQELSETQFNDGSEQFINGEFSDEIGDDFFGFKELGLDKEFGMLTSSIPLHLLQSKLGQHMNNSGKGEINSTYTELEKADFPRLSKKSIYDSPAIFIPYLEDLLSKSKTTYYKALKKHQQGLLSNENKLSNISQLQTTDNISSTINGNADTEFNNLANGSDNGTAAKSSEKGVEFVEYANDDDIPLMETEDLSMKQRNNRLKIPPSGKITQIKKKNSNVAFFLEKQDELEGKIGSVLEKVKLIKEHVNSEKSKPELTEEITEKQKSDANKGKTETNSADMELDLENVNEEDEDDEEEDDEDDDNENDNEGEGEAAGGDDEDDENLPDVNSSQPIDEDDDDEDDEEEDMEDAIDTDIF